MLSKINSGAIIGVEPKIISVEVDVGFGLKNFLIVGLPDKSIEESSHRINASLKNSGFKNPQSGPFKVTVNLSPADIKKEGTIYDLPIAIGFLKASKQIKCSDLENKIIIGELSLNGDLKPVRGALIFSILAKESGIKEIILPKDNEKEACLIKGINIIGVQNIKEAADYLEGRIKIPPASHKNIEPKFQNLIDISQIKGQYLAKRALQIAASGFHNILFEGPPGAGKTLLAKSAVSIMPPLSYDEIIELTKIYSVTGNLPESGVISERPFRNPHHSSSESAIIGGGNPPKPGEITLSHKGILFLDEFPEFHRDVIESLRQPLEEGVIKISRAKYSLSFPAKFMLICCANPCPCGYYNSDKRECVCTMTQINNYRRKLSGPIVDRIDIFVKLKEVEHKDIIKEPNYSEVQNIKEGVIKAYNIQKERFKKYKIKYNSEMDVKLIERFCRPDNESEKILANYMNSGKLSARGYHKVLKIARTIADIKEKETIGIDEVSEALTFRHQNDTI